MKHFTLDEFLRSATAKKYRVDMTPSQAITRNLDALVNNVLDPLRESLGRPIKVTSGFRPMALNALVGGTQRSQHCLGQAADIIVEGMTVKELCDFILAQHLPFDQLIYEFGTWAHVSYGPRNRREVLTASRVGKRVMYSKGLPQ